MYHPDVTPPDKDTFWQEFTSPTFGVVSFDSMFAMVAEYISEEPAQTYNLIIGTDSFLNTGTLFVSAVIIHRVGHGGRYFYKKMRRRKIDNMRQRIFHETTLSIELASLIREKLNGNGFRKLPVEIHLDVGTNGGTREIIKEVVGMVTGSGYAAITKPASYGASKVADRHSK
ncbi:MAG: ribonuclease H-like YkuK family protein [Deltaproteobacteria bacterium]|nr:ribonuclease H-like YkuK family protein [Deltaproteobacteria bacterium]